MLKTHKMKKLLGSLVKETERKEARCEFILRSTEMQMAAFLVIVWSAQNVAKPSRQKLAIPRI